MKSITLISSILSLTFASFASAQRLSITTGKIDSLQMPYSLSQLTENFRNTLTENDRDVVKKILDIVKDYYALSTSKKELKILSIEASNLKAIWKLNKKLADKGEISDLQLLASQNAYLSKQAALIAKESECRNYLFEIIHLGFLKIEIKEDGKKEINTAAD